MSKKLKDFAHIFVVLFILAILIIGIGYVNFRAYKIKYGDDMTFIDYAFDLRGAWNNADRK